MVSSNLLGIGSSILRTITASPLTILRPTCIEAIFTLLLPNKDPSLPMMPGIIGKLGSLLGSNNVNIASMQVGRKIVRGEAVMVLSIDDPIPNKLLDTIIEVDGITNANPVTL